MSFLSIEFSETDIYGLELWLGDNFFWLSLIFLAFEFIRLMIKKSLKLNILGDAVANFVTLAASIGINFTIGLLYLSIFYYFYENVSLTQLPINGWTIIICIVLADFIYYWEHRFMHRVGFGWATHAVHHSSPYFNISVAYRLGPLDSFIPVFFHIPLAMLGFNPFLILFAEIVVQLYQTALHTEVIGKFPKIIERIFNTPSHHRVHHGSNPEYLDKNYAGILIIWDRMFGTFEEEKEKVVYGVTEPINSVNPIIVFFCGFIWMFKRIKEEKGFGNKIKTIFLPPDWKSEP
ncbi:sterol desaturase family protein [Kordiimonas sp. SCSIO 12610]|uniref:sterol desaturase family protein n=1 Tax=Kordiimonas sp. SCSIO 12610 TaxID=2829597 RepID=UPI00210D2CC3|nr:sterol desaturase family protein [Kordiimonas sp. SCSIO 12610]UTW55210.1 sterol desaturase family protein [Kordiimonas sp. SCSIO 12610]